MSRSVSYAILAIFVAAAIAYFTLGPNVFLGGPSKNDIITVTRQAMETAAATPELKQAAQAAAITPTGLCNNTGEAYACAVEVTVPGQPAKTFVSLIKKDASGWVATE